jgi:drug/metabolite transporter (DMT)-like permease
MFFASASSIYIRKYMLDFDAFDIASIRMIFAAITLFFATTLFIGFDLSQVNTQGYLALGYASLVGTFSGMILVIFVIHRFGATTSAMTTYVIPIVASVVGTFLLGEQITRGMLAGMVLIAIGIGIINQKRVIIQDSP